jgi:hypothetical protein
MEPQAPHVELRERHAERLETDAQHRRDVVAAVERLERGPREQSGVDDVERPELDRIGGAEPADAALAGLCEEPRVPRQHAA